MDAASLSKRVAMRRHARLAHARTQGQRPDVLFANGRSDFGFLPGAPHFTEGLAVIEFIEEPVEALPLVPWNDHDADKLRLAPGHWAASKGRLGHRKPPPIIGRLSSDFVVERSAAARLAK